MFWTTHLALRIAFFLTKRAILPHFISKNRRELTRSLTGNQPKTATSLQLYKCHHGTQPHCATRPTWPPTWSMHTPWKRNITVEVAIEDHRHLSSTSQRLRPHLQRLLMGPSPQPTSEPMSAHAKQSTIGITFSLLHTKRHFSVSSGSVWLPARNQYYPYSQWGVADCWSSQK
jgi:hypothetical protein